MLLLNKNNGQYDNALLIYKRKQTALYEIY
jgi:hypothetical protein